MAKRAFYRKYRPKKLSEVMGQPHITRTLENALEEGTVSHAYLFSGPRGVGKTSVARIFAHEVNNIEYTDDSTHLDIIEIDAASNRRIDEIRDLRDKIGISPSSATYKVYIIDEVHMLTKEAFNALLKTLEEPPAHAIFILATTEAYKLPDTILSRAQRHNFKPISKKDLVNHLSMIATKENITVSSDALELIASHASGSFRDGLSLLDQLATSHDKSISLDDVRDSLGLASKETVEELVAHIIQGSSKDLLIDLEKSLTSGVSASQLARQIVEYLQASWSHGVSFSRDELRMVDGLLEVQSSSESEIKLNIVLLEACLNAKPRQLSEAQDAEHSHVKATIKKDQTVRQSIKESDSENLEGVVQTRQFNAEAWDRALSKIKNINNSLYAVLRMAKAGLNGSDDVVILTFQFPFHQKQVSSGKNKKIVEDILSEEIGQPIKLKLNVDKEIDYPINIDKDNQIKHPVKDDYDVGGIIDIMGGGEVVNI